MSGKSIDTSVEESQTQLQARRSTGEFVRGDSGFKCGAIGSNVSNALSQGLFAPRTGFKINSYQKL